MDIKTKEDITHNLHDAISRLESKKMQLAGIDRKTLLYLYHDSERMTFVNPELSFSLRSALRALLLYFDDIVLSDP